MPKSPFSDSERPDKPLQSHSQTSINKPTTYLSVKEFTQRVSISESTVRRRIDSGEIPSVQPGGHRKAILIPENALDSLLSASVQPTGPDGDESVSNQTEKPADAPESTSSADSSSSTPRRRGPQPRWQRNPPR